MLALFSAGCSPEVSQSSGANFEVVDRLMELASERREFRERAQILFDSSQCPSTTPASLSEFKNEVGLEGIALFKKLQKEPALMLDFEVSLSQHREDNENLMAADCEVQVPKELIASLSTEERNIALGEDPKSIARHREQLEQKRRSIAALRAYAEELKQKVES